MKNVVIQGFQGSYHHQAAMQLMGQDISLVYCTSFEEVFAKALAQKSYALVATFNSTIGDIRNNQQRIDEEKWMVEDVIDLSINHQLIGSKDAQFETIRKVMSQKEALMQCQLFIEKHHLQLLESTDTALSVQYIAQQQNGKDVAAIGSTWAAQYYQLPILAENIADKQDNYTRFVLISNSN